MYSSTFHSPLFLALLPQFYLEKVSKCLIKPSKFKRRPHSFELTFMTVTMGFYPTCAFQNSYFYFFHLAIFICLTSMILKSYCLTFWYYVLLCLTIVFCNSSTLKWLFLLGSRVSIILFALSIFHLCVHAYQVTKRFQSLYLTKSLYTFSCLTFLIVFVYVTSKY